MDPRSFRDLAAKLAGRAEPAPAEHRSAMSRAYYAAFHVAAALLREWHFKVPENADGHGEVQDLLTDSGDPRMMQVASELGTLRTKRNQADYKLDRRDVEVRAQAIMVIVNTRMCRPTPGSPRGFPGPSRRTMFNNATS